MTIVDRREIAFDSAALLAVLACSDQMIASIGLPSVPPNSLRFDPRARAIVLFYGIMDQPVPVPSGPLSALLIAYCMRAGIKVPRLGARGMRIEQNCVALVFSATHPVPGNGLKPERPEEPSRSISWMGNQEPAVR